MNVAGKGGRKINSEMLMGKPPLEYIFFHFSKHYYATNEVSLFLSVLINKVIKD